MTEQEILKKFEENFAIIRNDDDYLELINEWDCILFIDKGLKRYECCYKSAKGTFEFSSHIDLETHQLLTELFRCYGWIE